MKLIHPDIWLNVRVAAEMLQVSTRIIQLKCKNNEFEYRITKGRGGDQYEILLSSLPADAQFRYQDMNKPQQTSKRIQRLLTKQEEQELYYKISFLQEYKEYSENAPFRNKVEAKNKFIEMHNNAANPEELKHLGKLTFKTVERWLKTMKESGPTSLIKNRKPKGSTVSQREAEIIMQLLLNPNEPLVSETLRMAKKRMITEGISPKSDKTYREFVKNWKSNNYDMWVFYRGSSKKLNDKVQYYIERSRDIEVGDIIVADGHNLNFEMINPYTGKLKRMMLMLYYDMKSNMPLGWEISPTENTSAISMALYRSILLLGKIPKVVYIDNGRAFGSKYFKDYTGEMNGVITRLGSKLMTAWPYHAQSKPVEGFFRIFAELERRMPTYSGTSIENKPARMSRGEILHKQVYERLTEGSNIDIWTAHKVIAEWFDEYAHREQQSGKIKGLRPIDVFNKGKGEGIDADLIRFLLMKQSNVKVGRHGITLLGNHYWNDALYGLNQLVLIQYDIQNLNEVYVYDFQGTYICSAEKKIEVHPAAYYLGTEQQQQQLKTEIERKKRLEKYTCAGARAFLQNNMLEDISRTTAQAEEIRKQAEIKKEETKETPSFSDVDFSVEEQEEKDDNPYKDLDFGISGIA